MKTEIRAYRPVDAPLLAKLFFDSIRQGAATAYTKEQIEAWAPGVPESTDWAARLDRQRVVVAEDDDGMAGFMTLDNSGYIDLAFVRPDRIGSGVGSLLYNHIEQAASAGGMSQLTSQASELARLMFERNGWAVVRTRQIERRGVTLVNHCMEKWLNMD